MATSAAIRTQEEAEAREILEKEYQKQHDPNRKPVRENRIEMDKKYTSGIDAWKEGNDAFAVWNFKELAHQGMLQAMFNCAVMYRYGWGDVKDLPKALGFLVSFFESLDGTHYYNSHIEDVAVKQAIGLVRDQAEEKGENPASVLYRLGNKLNEQGITMLGNEFIKKSADEGYRDAVTYVKKNLTPKKKGLFHW